MATKAYIEVDEIGRVIVRDTEDGRILQVYYDNDVVSAKVWCEFANITIVEAPDGTDQD